MTPRCKYDREQETYLRDGEPCKVDEYGDPTTHCTARRSCGNHIGRGELTCARCVGMTRADIRAIVTRSCELLPEALEAGAVNTELAYLAGPAANVEQWMWRKIAARQGIAWHASLPVELGGDKKHVEEDDQRHPFTVLTNWQWQISIAYQHPEPDVYTLTGAADYLERTLPRFAQDPDQDFRGFRDEIRKCRAHIQTALSDSLEPERGAPCPDCRDEGRVIRLQREYPHWCEDADCERMHYADDSADRWVCPRGHWRSHEDYQRWIEERGEVAG